MGKLVADLETEDSLLHALLYEPESAAMVTDLQKTIEGLKDVVAGVKQGEPVSGHGQACGGFGNRRQPASRFVV